MKNPVLEEQRFKGQVICSGVAIGAPFFLVRKEDPIFEESIPQNRVGEEKARYTQALERSAQGIKTLQDQLKRESVCEAVAILDAHLSMLQDGMFTTAVEKEIEEGLINAEGALSRLLKGYEERFASIEDPLFKERLFDVQDVARRIMANLREESVAGLAAVREGSVVLAHDLVPTDTAEANPERVGAFVTQSGGATSHAAIVAKAKGIPYVSHVNLAAIEGASPQSVIVDGNRGEVIVNPMEQTLKHYSGLQVELSQSQQQLQANVGLKTETYDGYQVHLSANIEMADELELLHRNGGEGVGLFRSEFLCLTRNGFPSEEEQFETYQTIVSGMKGMPVVIRAFDLGGDKITDQVARDGVEPNSLFGCRAIRFLLKERELFKSQLKAILRASAWGNVSVMFPMVSGLPELRAAKAVLEEAREELVEQGVSLGSRVKVGCMIEVPSAAIISDILAQECDFLSIGTNDLVQYLLAVDRGSQTVGGLYGPTHPALIRLIRMVVTEGNRNGIPVTVCGEVASDPRFTALLLGLGVSNLSVSPINLPSLRDRIRKTSFLEAVSHAEHVLGLETALDVEKVLGEQVNALLER